MIKEGEVFIAIISGGMTTKERPFSVESVIDLAQVFPVKLYDLLSNPRYEEILAWRPSGVAFEILQPKRLVREVLPTIFNRKYLISSR